MEKGTYVKEKIEQYGYNIRSFSEKVELPYTTMRSLIERNFKKATIENVVKICKELNIPITKFASEDEEVVSENLESDMIRIPYLHDSKIAVNNIPIPKIMLKNYNGDIEDLLALEVNNDSMNELIKENSLVLLQRIKQSEIQNKDIIYIMLENTFELRRVYFLDSGMIIKNESSNPKYLDFMYDKNRKIDIIGKVISFVTET